MADAERLREGALRVLTLAESAETRDKMWDTQK